MRFHFKVCFLVILWISFSSITLLAQKVSLKNVKLDISLKDYRLEDIIDGTPDGDHIGYVYKGLVNSTLKQIYLDDSVTEEFEYLFQPVFSKSKDAIPLVILINSIQVNEWAELFSKKVNLTSISLSIFQQVEDDKYILIADRIINNYNKEGVKNEDIGNCIGQAVNRAFDYLDLLVDKNRPGLTWTELWAYEPYQGLPYPRLDDDLKLFEHYSDYRSNKPLEGATASLVDRPSGAELLHESGQHPIDIWGYSIQGMLYINMGNKFVPLERVDLGYVATLNSNDRRDFQDGLSIFGVSKILGILTMILSENHFELPLSKQTGFLDIKSIYDSGERKDRDGLGDQVIIEFAPFGQPDDILDIKIDDQLIIQLSKGEFFEIPNNLNAKELQACVDGRCQIIEVGKTPMHRIVFKKGIISQEAFTEKERMRYIRNVDLKYWVLF